MTCGLCSRALGDVPPLPSARCHAVLAVSGFGDHSIQGYFLLFLCEADIEAATETILKCTGEWWLGGFREALSPRLPSSSRTFHNNVISEKKS